MDAFLLVVLYSAASLEDKTTGLCKLLDGAVVEVWLLIKRASMSLEVMSNLPQWKRRVHTNFRKTESMLLAPTMKDAVPSSELLFRIISVYLLTSFL